MQNCGKKSYEKSNVLMFLDHHFCGRTGIKKIYRQLLPRSARSNYIVLIFLKLISITSFAGSFGTDA